MKFRITGTSFSSSLGAMGLHKPPVSNARDCGQRQIHTSRPAHAEEAQNLTRVTREDVGEPAVAAIDCYDRFGERNGKCGLKNATSEGSARYWTKRLIRPFRNSNTAKAAPTNKRPIDADALHHGCSLM